MSILSNYNIYHTNLILLLCQIQRSTKPMRNEDTSGLYGDNTLFLSEIFLSYYFLDHDVTSHRIKTFYNYLIVHELLCTAG